MKTFIVYLATNVLNGKRYIGATSRGIAMRKRKHFQDARAKRPGCRVFNAAIRKYGADAFEWSVIATASSFDEMMREEVRLIEELKPEYNITAGGQGMIGLVRTREWMEKTSRALKGRKHPPELVERMRHYSKERLFKSVVCLNDGRFFRSHKEAALFYGIGKRRIGEVTSGREISCDGYSFVKSDRPFTEVEIKIELARIEERREAWDARRNKEKRRPIICLNDLTVHPSGRAAAAAYGIAISRVMQLCQTGRVLNPENDLRLSYYDKWCEANPMKIKFFVSSGESFGCDAPLGSDRDCYALPKDADRFEFWRQKTGDDRIRGHAMVWEVA